MWRLPPWLFLWLCVWCSAASALSRDVEITDLRHTSWGPQSGAPSGNAIAQTKDGYLWFGSQNGLFRFDGLKFDRIDFPGSSKNVFQLFASPTGGLWIGPAAGGAVFMKDGVSQSFTPDDGLPIGTIMAFAQGSDGTVWAGGYRGLGRYKNGHWERIGVDWKFPEGRVFSLMMDSADTLWAASDRMFFALAKGATMFRAIPMQASDDFSFAESPNGGVWLWDETGIRQIAQNPNKRRQTASSGRNFAFDRDGGFWIKTDLAEIRRASNPVSDVHGAPIKYDEISEIFGTKQGLAAGRGPTVITEDSEGNVWLFGHSGIDRFSERRLTPLRSVAAITPGNAGLAPTEELGLWISSRDTGGEAIRVQGGRTDAFKALVGTSSVLTAADGSTWFGGIYGLAHLAEGRIDHVPVPAGMETLEIQTMAEDSSGGLWVQFVSAPGLFRWADGAWTAAPGGDQGLAGSFARILASDASGRVWSGGSKGRIAVVQNGSVKVYPKQETLKVGAVTAIYGRRNNIWVGGDLGLARLNGEAFENILPEAGKEFGNITGIVETGTGDLWLNGASGISHIPAEQVRLALADPTYRVKVEELDLLDGFEGTGSRIRPVPTLIETADKRLWFASSAGVYWVDPAKIVRNPLPPPVRIQSVIADGMLYPIKADLNLPERTKSLQFDYVGLSFMQPERVRYRYRLEGFDAAWQDVQSRRQAFYTNLAPGTYRFQVIAMNNDGVWNEHGESVRFTIPPAFVQTGWFIALCGAISGAIVWLLIIFRIRQLHARTRVRFEARLAERERIARELHDTLLQSTQGLILKFQAVADGLAADDPHRALMERYLANADSVMAEGRDRVLDLRIPVNTLADLHQAFLAVAKELSVGSAIRCVVSTEGAARKLRSRVVDEAYRIGREALINAFFHSRATSIDVHIKYGDDALRIIVRDDGVGIDALTLEERARPGHFGLRGMQERAREISGTLEIPSQTCGGTEIELRVPAAMAYGDRALRAGWSSIFRALRPLDAQR